MTREEHIASAPALLTRTGVERIAGLDDCREEWSELAAAAGSLFSTWEWASTWWRHADPRSDLLLHGVWSEDGGLRILLPLYLWSTRPFRVARFLGHGPADQLGPVCRAADSADAADALKWIAASARLDVVLAESLVGVGSWRAALGARSLLTESSPKLSIADGWASYLATRSPNLRQQIRARERRLTNRYDLRFRLASELDELHQDLTVLFSLHRARWGASPFTRWERFHREFADVALRRGWLRLWFLELDGRPAAAWYGFRYAGVEWYYQAGRDPDRTNESVGFVLLAHTIREAANDGMHEYRLLRGGEAFKMRFADSDDGLETLALTRGRRGALAAGIAAAGLRSGRIRALARPLSGLQRSLA